MVKETNVTLSLSKGMKQTEIGLIPEDWEVYELEELTRKIASGKSNTSSHPTGDYTIYGSTGIIGNKNYFDYEGEKITVARVGANAGLINFINGKYCISDNTLFIDVSDSIQITFLYKYLQSINLNKFVFGSGQPLITGTILKNLQIPLPPLFEQEAIATALSDCDSWIDSIEEVLAKKRLIKQGAMQELLTPKEDWEVKKLGEVLLKIIGGGTPSRIVKSYWNGNIPWMTVKDFASFIPNGTQEYISEDGLKNSATRIVKAGSIIIATRIALGQIVRYNVDVTINQDLKTADLHNSVNPEYFIFYYRNISHKIIEKGSGSTVLGLSIADLKNFEIPLPSLLEQTRIATILSDMDLEIEALEEKGLKARQIKQGMMQELLTGSVRLV